MLNCDRYKKLKDSVGQCELCGNKGPLEVHHIFPKVVERFTNVDLDIEDNVVVVCSKCHGRLTNRSLSAKIGIDATRQDNVFHEFAYEFYSAVDADAEDLQYPHEVVDIFTGIYSKFTDEIRKKKGA